MNEDPMKELLNDLLYKKHINSDYIEGIKIDLVIQTIEEYVCEAVEELEKPDMLNDRIIAGKIKAYSDCLKLLRELR